MSKMLEEAREAPQRIRTLLTSDADRYLSLGRRLRALQPAVVGTIARGSSDHAAEYATYLVPLCTGRIVASIPPSVVTVLNAPLRLKGQFVLAMSQGGGSPDIFRAMTCAREGEALTAAVVNDTSSPLACAAEVLLPQHAGAESISATKSALATMTAVARLTAEWVEDKALLRALEALPAALQESVDRGVSADDSLLRDVSHVYVLSRGLGYCAAREVALKLKETCGIHAESFSTAEVRHGPREIVDKRFLVIALALPQSGDDDVVHAMRELEGQGARAILVSSSTESTFTLPRLSDNRLAPIVALQCLYTWIARSATAMGRDPDNPRTLKEKVIKTV